MSVGLDNSKLSLDNSKLSLDNGKLHEICLCPISLELLTDPVIDECGHTFDRKTMLDLFQRNNNGTANCPLTNNLIRADRLVTNYAVKSLSEELAAGGFKFDTNNQMMTAMWKSIMQSNHQLMQSNQQLMQSNQQLTEENRAWHRRMAVTDFELSLVHVQNKQLRNLTQMGLLERFAVWSGALDQREIENRDLTDAERVVLNREAQRRNGQDIFAAPIQPAPINLPNVGQASPMLSLNLSEARQFVPKQTFEINKGKL